MAGHYQRLLEGIVADPGQPIGQIPLLADEERQQILEAWNDTGRAYPQQCIHQLFEEQVERTPESVALVFEDQQLSYRELNSRSNRLAHFLQSLGVGPETLVAICVERSLEMVIGLLGILKAGGAYVPLDPKYPPERLRFMLHDTRTSVLLTQESLASSLPEVEARVVYLDRDWARIEDESQGNPYSTVTAHNLAYVIYTSGSTGKPKGVAIEHRSSVALIDWSHEVFSKSDLAGVLCSTSLCFDLSVFEIFVPLSCGGKVIIAPNALALPTLATVSEITLVNTVPSALAELISLDAIPESVITVNLAGEPLQQRLVREIYGRTRTNRVFDLYGPSESTTYSTYALRTMDGPQTIGRPISNTRVFVLNHRLEPVPVGVAGELYIGGAGLARGYLNRPELTAERFVSDPFSGEPGARLYKTGDQVRWRADGNLEYLGRLDDQVKFRGFRIELGEIEASLARHPGLRRSVVVAREEEPGDKRLVAYLVPVDQAAPPSAAELRSFLSRGLPEFMIPSAFVVLDRLPLSPNGKVDRKALPKPGEAWAETSNFIAPRTPIEEILVGIWAEVLGSERVGVADNFFDLGGHSLRAMRVIARVRDVLGVEVAMRTFFEAPTVQGMAVAIDRKLFEPAELR